jgi:hypothetical protein
MDSLTELRAGSDAILITGGLFMTLAGIALSLRFLTRPIIKVDFGADDWCLLIALLFFYASEVFEFEGKLED